ncbi:hypothetical protein ACFWPK_22370 [Nocardia sp. NPDC058519]|uniref:VG15 protein n=1 Tax=Nocardia sp. NPDC058519 TaxID=3346535 RepID=UPI00366233EB
MTTPVGQRQRQEQPEEQDSTAEELAWLAALLVLIHQDEQIEIAAGVVSRMLPLWALLNFQDLRGSQTAWIQAVLPIVEDGYRQSQLAAQRFVTDYRHAKLPAAPELEAITGRAAPISDSSTEAPPTTIDVGDALGRALKSALGEEPAAAKLLESDRAAKVLTDTVFEPQIAAVSLLGTGPGEVQRRMPAPETDAMEAGRLLAAKVATRITTDGGRAVVQRAVDLDSDAIGWARVLNISPCSFCAILASRGASYKRGSFDASDRQFEGIGTAKVHDGCRCGMRPVYTSSDFHDPTAQDALDQWYELTNRRMSRREAMNAFRRGYVAPDPPPAPRVDLHQLLVVRNRLLEDGFGETSDQVRWVDKQIGRFDAFVETAIGADDAVKIAAARARRGGKTTSKSKRETAVDRARRLLPGFERELHKAIAAGIPEDSAGVQVLVRAIESFRARLPKVSAA